MPKPTRGLGARREALVGAEELELPRDCCYAAFSVMVTANPRASILCWSRFASAAGS